MDDSKKKESMKDFFLKLQNRTEKVKRPSWKEKLYWKKRQDALRKRRNKWDDKKEKEIREVEKKLHRIARPRSLWKKHLMKNIPSKWKRRMKDSKESKEPEWMFRIKKRGFIRDLTKDFPKRVKKPIKPSAGLFGGYPSPLGIEEIVDIKLTKYGKAVCTVYPDIISDISYQMRRILYNIKIIGIQYINKFVPADVGNSRYKNTRPNIRRSLSESLSERNNIVPPMGNMNASDLQLHIRFYSDLYYAGIVNEMPESMIRHQRSNRKRSWKTGEYLHDPYVKQNFFGLIKNKLKRDTRSQLIPYFLTNIRNILKNKDNKFKNEHARAMFSIRSLGRGKLF